MDFFKKDLFLTITFYVFIALLIASRIQLFFDLNINYIDSDMPFMWAGIKDYSQGLFYEPRFYGQDYNTFMESLFAVPLYWLGIPVYYALPVVSHIVAIFPFLFTAFYLFYKERKENAILILSILLCLTPGYYIMTSQPRGISGVFLTGFFILSILHPTNFRFLVLNTLLSVLAYFVTPNSVVVSVPLMAFLFFQNYKNKKYYVTTFCCLLIAIPCYLFFDKFYKDYPGYIVYGLQNDWSPSYFFETLKHLNRNFAHICILTEENCSLLLVLIFCLAIALFRKNKIAFLAFLSFLSLILLSFFTSKVNDGVVWPFYSYSRMYIGIPMVIALFTVFFQIRSRILILCLLVVTLGYSSFKFITFKSSLAYHTDEKRWNGIHLTPLPMILEACEDFKGICKKNDADFLLISSTFWMSTYLNYGGQCIDKDFPASEETFAERRYWVREGNKEKVFRRFIFLSVDFDFDTYCAGNSAFKIKRLDDYGLMLVEDNTLKNKDFISLSLKLENK